MYCLFSKSETSDLSFGSVAQIVITDPGSFHLFGHPQGSLFILGSVVLWFLDRGSGSSCHAVIRMGIRGKGAGPAICPPFKTKAKLPQNPLLQSLQMFSYISLVRAGQVAPLVAAEARKLRTWYERQDCHVVSYWSVSWGQACCSLDEVRVLLSRRWQDGCWVGS